MEDGKLNQPNLLDNVNSQYSVLVVEDDEGLNKLICRNLQREGFTIQSAITATDAIDTICSNPEDPGALLLLDYRLPDMTGKGLIEKLKAKQYEMPFIVMTGFGDQKIAVEMMKLGARDYVVKDYDFIERLPQVINRTLKEIETEKMLKKAEEEKIKLEQQLRQAQKMEAIGVLAGGVAHDFNNLLTAIHGYNSLAMNEVEKDSTLYSKLEQVQRAAERAANLTRQLLFFSRKQPMECKLLNLSTVVDNMLKMLQRLIGEEIRVVSSLAADVWSIKADVGNMEQVIMNLAVNARDAMPGGGRLQINVRNTTFSDNEIHLSSEARSGRYVCLNIEDSGTGMDKETLQHIFDPFFTTKESGKGTGLGMSVVYGIVSSHGGWIDIYSEPGIGTTFSIYFPASDSAVKDLQEETIGISTLRGNGEHILVVEDDDDIREWSVIALNESGYNVSEAQNAREALEIFNTKKGEIALLLSDVVMPDKSGFKLAEELIAKKPELKIVLSSGYAGERSQSNKIKEYGLQFLQKPYTMIQLLSLVKEVLEG